MRKAIIILVAIFLSGCSKYVSSDLENKIFIEKININKEYSISSISEKVNGIVLFEEYGRPDIDLSNTVIGAHSGYGSNALFNYINKLEYDDEIILYYDNQKYVFLVEDVLVVEENNISILEDRNFTSLSLITCNVFNNKERILVVARLSV